MNPAERPTLIDFRVAHPSEISLILGFIFAHGTNQWNFLSEEDLKRHLAGIASGSTVGLIAQRDGEMVGIATWIETGGFENYRSAHARPARCGQISEVVVARDRCGQGIGTALMAECIRAMGIHGLTHIYAERHEENRASAGMMRKAGFEIVDTFFDPERRSSGSRKTTICRFTRSHSTAEE